MCRDVEGNLLTEESAVITRWRRMNHELHALLGEPTIIHMVKIGNLRWAPAKFHLVELVEEEERSVQDGWTRSKSTSE